MENYSVTQNLFNYFILFYKFIKFLNNNLICRRGNFVYHCGYENNFSSIVLSIKITLRTKALYLKDFTGHRDKHLITLQDILLSERVEPAHLIFFFMRAKTTFFLFFILIFIVIGNYYWREMSIFSWYISQRAKPNQSTAGWLDFYQYRQMDRYHSVLYNIFRVSFVFQLYRVTSLIEKYNLFYTRKRFSGWQMIKQE